MRAIWPHAVVCSRQMWHEISSIRKYLRLSLVGLALLGPACHRKAPAPPVQASVPLALPLPPPGPSPTPQPAPIPDTIPSLPSTGGYFDLGEKYFQVGDYPRAAKAYETYLRSSVSLANQDQALFRLALTRFFPGSPVRDIPQALNLFRLLVKSFPQSAFRPQAQMIITMQAEIDRMRVDVGKRDERIQELTRELEKLKQIDMQRRPPGSP
jgi:tetratricopeptide (TPR) repeat protein